MWEMMGYNATYRLFTIALILCRGVPIAAGPFAVFRGTSSVRCAEYLRSPDLSEMTPLPPTGCDQSVAYGRLCAADISIHWT